MNIFFTTANYYLFRKLSITPLAQTLDGSIILFYTDYINYLNLYFWYKSLTGVQISSPAFFLFVTLLLADYDVDYKK